MKKINFFLFILICCSSCYSLEYVDKVKKRLKNKGIEDIYTVSDVYRSRILIYFTPTLKSIISKVEIPYIEDEIVLYYQLEIDVKRKALIHCWIKQNNKESLLKDKKITIEIINKIGKQIHNDIIIKYNKLLPFNYVMENRRNERLMANISLYVRIKGNEICIDKYGWSSDTVKVKNKPLSTQKRLKKSIPLIQKKQNATHDFLMQKFDREPQLLEQNFNPKRLYIIKNWSANIWKEILEFNFLDYTKTINLDSISNGDFLFFLNKVDSIESQIKHQRSIMDSLFKEEINSQVKINNKTTKHNTKRIATTMRKYNPRARAGFEMSNPIFFDNNKQAFIWIRYYYGVMPNETYMEYYTKNKLGKWLKISSHLQ